MEKNRDLPVTYYLNKAYDILTTKGTNAFHYYYESVNMSLEDIERVEFKFQFITDPQFRAYMEENYFKPLRLKLKKIGRI